MANPYFIHRAHSPASQTIEGLTWLDDEDDDAVVRYKYFSNNNRKSKSHGILYNNNF